MKWTIYGVLLVVVFATAVKEGGDGPGQGGWVESPELTTISKIGRDVKEREMAQGSWYCYEMATLIEEPIAMSLMAIFASGDNKEGKTIKLGKLTVLAGAKDQLKVDYCVVAPQDTNETPLTPTNEKIKYDKQPSMKFYSTKVFMRDPLSISQGIDRLTATLTKIGVDKKVQFDRPTVIYNLGEAGGEILFPET